MIATNKTILILHGWNSSRKSWARVEELLSQEGFDVLVPDFPGFGDEPPPKEPWTNEDYLNWILNYIKTNELTSSPANELAVVGHSFGGGIAMKLAIEYPELVDKLILVAAARIKHKKSLYKRFVGWLAKKGRGVAGILFLRKLFYKFVVRERDYIQTKGVMRETFRNVIKDDLTPEIHKIKTPTLIIWGDKDKMTPIKDAHIIHGKIEGSDLKIIPGARHALNLEHPEKLAKYIVEFLSK